MSFIATRKNLILVFLFILISFGESPGTPNNTNMSLIQINAAKASLLENMDALSEAELKTLFDSDNAEACRKIIIDGNYRGQSKVDFLQDFIYKCPVTYSIRKNMQQLLQAHLDAFGKDQDHDLMIFHASDSIFNPFGGYISYDEALAQIKIGDEVQAFHTIFETGSNKNTFVHKMEAHANEIEYVLALTDIIYGLCLVSDFEYSDRGVKVDPKKIKLFYVEKNHVIALHPLVVHSGSLSTNPNNHFSIMVYKKATDDTYVYPFAIPEEWEQHKDLIKLKDRNKYFLTLEDGPGDITEKRLRIP